MSDTPSFLKQSSMFCQLLHFLWKKHEPPPPPLPILANFQKLNLPIIRGEGGGFQLCRQIGSWILKLISSVRVLKIFRWISFRQLSFFGYSKILYKILEVHFTNFSGKSEASKSYKILFVWDSFYCTYCRISVRRYMLN